MASIEPRFSAGRGLPCPYKEKGGDPWSRSRAMRVQLAALFQAAHLGTATCVRNIFAEGGGQVDLMILLLHENLADLFGEGEFPKLFALANAVAVVANGFGLVFEVEPEHGFRIFRG